jgi:DNA repair exonuclease SbcCD ATPase subunit
MPHEDLQKWIDASVKATQLKFALEDILTNNFSAEEMESLKYRQLMGTVDQYLEHVMSKYRKEKEEKIRAEYVEQIDKLEKQLEKLKKEVDKNKKSSSILNVKSATIASVGAILLELAKFIFNAVKGG